VAIILPGGWFADGPSADNITSTPLMAVERALRSVNSPLMRVMAEFCARSSGTFCGDLAKMTMLASGYTSNIFLTKSVPLGPVAPRIKKRMVVVVVEEQIKLGKKKSKINSIGNPMRT